MSAPVFIHLHTENGEAIRVNANRILVVRPYRDFAHANCQSEVAMNIPNLTLRVRETGHEFDKALADASE